MPTRIVISTSNPRWISVFLSLGLLLFVIGFASPHWADYDEQHTGLWKGYFCYITGCKDVTRIHTNNPDWFKATQALETLGLIALLLAFIILFLYMCVESCRGRNALMAVMISIFAGVAFIIIGVIIFSTKNHSFTIGWSMGVAIAGAVFSFIAGVMVVMGYLGK
ncbi:uncharacterized protein LOC115213003 [Argonauta hians]